MALQGCYRGCVLKYDQSEGSLRANKVYQINKENKVQESKPSPPLQDSCIRLAALKGLPRLFHVPHSENPSSESGIGFLGDHR